MKHMMIDLETLGRSPSCVFAQIGWCMFDPNGPVTQDMPSGTIFVDVVDAQRCGLPIDADTVLWWLRQERAAQQQMLVSGRPLAVAIQDLYQVWDEHRPAKIWANSPSFDLVILHDAARRVGRTMPWKFWDERDVRTVVDETGIIKSKPLIAHVAVEDCKAQARNVISALRAMKG